MRWMFLWLMSCAVAAMGSSETNLVRNPGFEADADGDRIPDEWRAAGDDRSVTQNLSFDKGRDGGRCARLSCTRFRAESPASHAMLCQLGVPVRRGKTYRVTLWARGEGILGEIVSVGLSDTTSWTSCGLDGSFAPTRDWQRCEFLFQATRECSSESRFQIWFNSTGTLWLDDIEFVEAGPNARRPGRVISAAERRNLVPNASFECGSCGWGSAEWDRAAHWGGGMNSLFGVIDKENAVHGQCSLRVELTPETQPVSFFDYFDLYRTPVFAPLVANIGFIEVEPGHPYTFSVQMKAARADTPARLAIRQFEGRSLEKAVRASETWERYAMTFTPTSPWCYVLAGPDLRKTDENPNPPRSATLWVDAVQLEKGKQPSAFVPGDMVELGIETDKPGNVFGWEEPVKVRLIIANSGATERRPHISMWLTDFFDAEVWRNESDVLIASRGRLEKEITLENSPKLRGFLRLHVKLQDGDKVSERKTRLAIVPLSRSDDSRFGVNHAYPWAHLLELSRKAGLVWVRDWSLKWKDIEPEKGQFTFAESDYQINRVAGEGLRMLCMLPFPSSPWSSSAPPEIRRGSSYEERRAVVAYAPRDMAEFENYVERTVAHYGGRVGWFQVFNEPLFTSYALPREHGYTGATYANYTRAFVRAARRANPQCKVLAGIGYLAEGRIMEDFREFFKGGGLDVIDAVDVHYYPRIRAPEFIEDLLEKLNSLMDEHGGRKPIWLTEYGYYADDDPYAVPVTYRDFDQPLASEQVQAEYAVRWATIMFANGVEKVFYHAGTCSGINGDDLHGVFYEYGGEPHKIYAAQAVMAHMFPPASRFVKRMSLGDGITGYLFRDEERLVAVVWAAGGAQPGAIRLRSEKMKLLDIVGREQARRVLDLSETPVYIIGEGMSAPEFEAALQ